MKGGRLTHSRAQHELSRSGAVGKPFLSALTDTCAARARNPPGGCRANTRDCSESRSSVRLIATNTKRLGSPQVDRDYCLPRMTVWFLPLTRSRDYYAPGATAMRRRSRGWHLSSRPSCIGWRGRICVANVLDTRCKPLRWSTKLTCG